MSLVLLILSSCAGLEPARQGNTDTAGDLPAPVTLDELLASTLPQCELHTPGSEIDFGARCVEGACTGDDLLRFEAMLGSPDYCGPIGEGTEEWFCSWGGISVGGFLDSDDDGTPDSDSDANSLLVDETFTGASSEGLATGVQMSCFVNVFGPPESVVFRDSAVTSISFASPPIEVDCLDSSMTAQLVWF